MKRIYQPSAIFYFILQSYSSTHIPEFTNLKLVEIKFVLICSFIFVGSGTIIHIISNNGNKKKIPRSELKKK